MSTEIIYKATGVRFSNWARFVNYTLGKRDQKSIVKEFCANCGLRYKKQKDIEKLNLPSKYLISSHRIHHLHILRDKAIYNDNIIFSRTQENLQKCIDASNFDITAMKDEISEIQEEIKKIRYRLTLKQTAVGTAGLQGNLGTKRALLQNRKDDLNDAQKELKEFEKQLKNNEKQFLKQVENINTSYKLRMTKYTEIAGRKINNVIGFTDYGFAPEEYSDKVQEILKGLNR